MSSLSPLTDDDIEAERKSDKHRRSKKIDDTVTNIIIGFMYLAAVLMGLGAIYCVILFGMYLNKTDSVDAKSIETIQFLATWVTGGAMGYIARLAKRNLNSDD